MGAYAESEVKEGVEDAKTDPLLSMRFRLTDGRKDGRWARRTGSAPLCLNPRCSVTETLYPMGRLGYRALAGCAGFPGPGSYWRVPGYQPPLEQPVLAAPG